MPVLSLHNRLSQSTRSLPRFSVPVFLATPILASVGLCWAGLIPIVEFSRERIEITVRPESILVSGLYIYENRYPVPTTQGLQVPFPVDSGQMAPATIEVWNVDLQTGEDSTPLQVLWIRGVPHFSVRVPARGTVGVRVRFRQYAPQRSAAYLLTTTQPWGQPLESGEYLLIPQGVRITESSYPFDRLDCLCFTRQQFLPVQEWEFAWKPQ